MNPRQTLSAIKARAKQNAPLLIALGIAAVFATILVIIESDTFEFGPLSQKGLIHYLDLKSLDIKFQNQTPPDLPEPKVVIAAVDEASIERYGLWPWNRTVLAQFVRKATEGGAKVIAFDGIFGDEDRNSSWASIKRFERAYEAAGLRPDSPLAKELAAAVATAESVEKNTTEALAKAGKAGALKGAQRAHEQAVKELRRAKAALDAWRQGSEKFYAMMRDEVSATSPDDAFADAIAHSPQTILGFVGFYKESELAGVSLEQARETVSRLAPVAITKVHEQFVQEVGGQEVPVYQPVEGLDLSKLQIRALVGVLSPLEKLSQAAKGFGYFNVFPDPDGPMRRVWLVNRFGNKLYPALSLISAARYFDSEIWPLNGSIDPGVTIDGFAPLNPASGAMVPTDRHARMLINYYADPAKYFPLRSVASIIDGTTPPSDYKGKVLMFGGTAQGTYDQRATPFSPNMPGVYVHAMAIQNMIDGRYIQRFFGVAIIEALVYLLLGALLGLVLPRVPAWAGTLVTGAVIAGFYLFDLKVVFPRGTFMLTVLPTIQLVLTFLAITIYGYLTEGKEKRMIRKAFQFYLTKSVVDEVLKDPTKLKLGGEKRVCTVMFSDVRGFTTISEKLSPEALVALLNSYLTPMTDIVYKYEGTLDKYIGDAIMAVYGAPVTYADHASRACKACLEMMDKLHEMQPGWRAQKLPEIDIGIGLNSGPMSAGNMGSSQRFDYTVMGDNVNLASRLEGINKEYGTNIIISESTYQMAKEDVYVREMDLVAVKGKHEGVRIYELLGLGKTPTPDHAALIEQFGKARALYRAQQWDDAAAAFNVVLTQVRPNDPASQKYIDRCAYMKEHPPGADWDGVTRMKTK